MRCVESLLKLLNVCSCSCSTGFFFQTLNGAKGQKSVSFADFTPLGAIVIPVPLSRLNLLPGGTQGLGQLWFTNLDTSRKLWINTSNSVCRIFAYNVKCLLKFFGDLINTVWCNIKKVSKESLIEANKFLNCLDILCPVLQFSFTSIGRSLLFYLSHSLFLFISLHVGYKAALPALLSVISQGQGSAWELWWNESGLTNQC